MCYNIQYIENRAEEYANRYKSILPPTWDWQTLQDALPVYYFVSGFSHPSLPVVKHDGIFLYEWGLIPSWAKDAVAAKDIQTKTLNAAGETVFEKPSFRKSIVSKRCLLGINGFYEWRDMNKVKYPHFIRTKSEAIFSLGCIYESWVDHGTGEIRNTFSVLTTHANPLMEKIHNLKKRMPLILKPQDEQKWIQPSLTPEEIKELIKPYDESDMTAFTVSRDANSARVNRNTPCNY
jgi:putative SOS response-associated peptidase YedK